MHPGTDAFHLLFPDTSCMAARMSFKELYDHLERYVASPDSRWRHVMRVKRGLRDSDAHGGYGNDQCYFEGKDAAYHGDVIRADSRFAPSQWETALLCNDVSNWLGANLESVQVMTLNLFPNHWPFVRGLHLRIPPTKVSETELWCFLCCYWPEQISG